MNINMQGSTLQVVEGAMQPVTSPAALLTGKIKIANDLFSVFANDGGDSRRFAVVFDAAMNVKYTPDELDENLKNACKMADEADKTAGWAPKVDAKGQAKYGPKRQAMNARASEIRQLFGALLFTRVAATHTDDGQEVQPIIGKTCGFSQAVKLARVALKDNAINWDNTPVVSTAQKAQITGLKTEAQVKADWVAKHPQEEGESIADYQQRMGQACSLLVSEKVTELQTKKVAALAAALIKKHGLDEAAAVAEQIIMAYNKTIEEEVHEEDQRIMMVGDALEMADEMA